MIRKLLPLVGALFISAYARADGLVKESPIGSVGSVSSVSVSTSAWTKIPALSSLRSRMWDMVRNPSTNSANMVCTVAGSIPTGAITLGEIEITKGMCWKVPVDNNNNLYCVSLNTSAESVIVREYKQ